MNFLDEAIKSVLNQTYANTEIIIVDDGSTDNTHSVASKYSAIPKINYLYQSHMGVAIAMNNGFKLSKGEFIMPLGADDILAPTYIEKCFKNLIMIKLVSFGQGQHILKEKKKQEQICLYLID